MEKIDYTKVRLDYVMEITDDEMAELGGVLNNAKTRLIFADIRAAFCDELRSGSTSVDGREIVDYAMPATKSAKFDAIFWLGLDERELDFIDRKEIESFNDLTESILEFSLGTIVRNIALNMDLIYNR